MSEGIAARVLDILENVAETPQVRQDLDLALFQQGLLDSFGMVQLMVAFEFEFGLEIPPTDVDRARWASPRQIIADVENRLRQTQAR